MNVRQLFGIILVITIMAALPVFAGDKPIKNEAELSYLETKGNTETISFNAKNTLTWAVNDKMNVIWQLAGLYSESDKTKNGEKYSTELRGDYLLTEKFYSSFIGGALKDEFAGVDAKYYVGPACGYKILNGPNHTFITEAGVDYVMEEYVDETDEDFFQGRVLARYEFAFQKKNKFFQTVEYLINFEESDDYQVKSETAVVYSFNDSVSLKTSYEVKYDHLPVPETLDDTDTTLSTTLIVNY